MFFLFAPSGLFAPLHSPQASAFTFYQTFDEFVRSIGFQVSAFDPCLYIMTVEGHCVLLLVYVDDVSLTGSSLELVARTSRHALK